MNLRLFTLGLCALLLPQTVIAQCPPTQRARELLEKTPIGHYTAEVLKRTDEGIDNARAADGGAQIVDLFSLHFLIQVQSILYMLVDTDLRSVEYHRNLTEVSACLHADLAMLEAQIENVRCEINAAYDRKSPEGIRILKSVANFLNQRYKHLVKGALDPQHKDMSWKVYYKFDNPFPGWCCVLDELTCEIRPGDECTEIQEDGTGGYNFFSTKDECITESLCTVTANGENDPKYKDICPFDSNYLAFNTSGYGCSVERIEQFATGSSGVNSMQAEADAAKEIEQKRDAFLEDIEHINTTTESMDDLVNNTMLTNTEREQLQRFGGTTTDEIDVRRVFGCNADLPPEKREDNAGVEGELTPNIKPSQEWAGIPLRGPFFFGIDHLTVWKKFFRLYHTWEQERQFADYLKHPDEFPEEADRKKAVERDNEAFGVLRAPRGTVRSVWLQFQLGQATQDVALLPKAQDMALQVRNAMSSVRPAMKRSIELVHKDSSPMRVFAKKYAYFLRRSCIFRPCNEKLEIILKTLFSDECFPYASGDFQVKKGDDTGKSTWERCQEAIDAL